MAKCYGPLYFSLFLVAACGPKIQSPFHYGKTTKSQLIEQKGEPLREEKLSRENAVVLVYPEEEKYQVESGIVTNSFKNPPEEQSTVLFWKHKFKDCETSEAPLEKSSHDAGEIFLACDHVGQGVVYLNGATHISRVIEYEKK